MTILCGTDFSAAAEQALNTAARLAVRSKARLHIAHCLQLWTEPHLSWSTGQLNAQAEQAKQLGADVRVHLLHGSPDEALSALASELAAHLIVVGPLGERKPGTFQLGSHADRLLQSAQVPVLVVRNALPFSAWLDGKQPLRVVLGADPSRSTDAAMRCIEDWQQLAPCDVTAVHLYWPPQQFSRLGLDGVRSLIDADPSVTQTLTRELAHRLSRTDRADAVRVLVEPHLGRVGDRLAELAHQREADLLVVGAHTRNALGRLLEGSVSRAALHAARTSVLRVPLPRSAAEVRVPHLRRVLAATDYSPAGNAAVALAYALCAPGGVVDLVHVTTRRDAASIAPHDIFALEQSGTADPRRAQTHAALNALVPTDAAARVTRCYALESNDAAEAIAQAAARLEADAICVGRRGRGGVAEAVLGSVSHGVVARADRPVLLAQAPRE